MIKQVKCVKVYWNDEQGTRPSFYPDLNAATASIDRALNSGGRHESAMNISLKAEVKVLNMDNPFDVAWYNRFVGKTCVDFGQCAGSPKQARKASVEKTSKTLFKPEPDGVPAQMQLPLQNPGPVADQKPSVGMRPDVWKLDAPADPARQAAGVAGGKAHKGMKLAPCPDRRPRGTVSVDGMNQSEKREYWRWGGYRKRQRQLGQTPIGFVAWKALVQKGA